MPFPPIPGDVLKMRILRKGKRRSLYSPASHARISISTVSDDSQIIRNRLRADSKLGHNTGFVAHNVAPAVELDHASAHHALRQVFVWGANPYLVHALILCCFGS